MMHNNARLKTRLCVKIVKSTFSMVRVIEENELKLS